MFKKMLFLLLVSFVACTSNDEPHEDIEYYERWSNYSHPVKLIGKIDSSEIVNLNSYCVAKFEHNNLISLTQYVADTVVYEFQYEYDSEGEFISKIN